MRAVIDGVEDHVVLGEQSAQTIVDGGEARFVEVAAPDRRLVGDDDEPAARGSQRPQAVDNAGQELDLIGVRQVVHLDVERAVSIEDDDRAVAARWPPLIAVDSSTRARRHRCVVDR